MPTTVKLTSFLWLIDSCQIKVSADQYHVTIVIMDSGLQFTKVVFFFTVDWVLVFYWTAGSSQVIALGRRREYVQTKAKSQHKLTPGTLWHIICKHNFYKLGYAYWV